MKINYLNENEKKNETTKQTTKPKKLIKRLGEAAIESLQKIKKSVTIAGITVLIIIGGVKCGEDVVQPPVVEITDAQGDVKSKDVKSDANDENKDAENDIEIIEDGSDGGSKDDSGDDIDSQDIQDIIDAEDIEEEGDKGSDTSFDSDIGPDAGNVENIEDGGVEIEDSGSIQSCELIIDNPSLHAPTNKIKISYTYYARDGTNLSCNTEPTKIGKVIINFFNIDGETEKDLLLVRAFPQLNIPFPKHNTGGYAFDESNEDFKGGVTLQLQQVENSNKLIYFVVPRQNDTLTCSGFNPPIKLIDGAAYACLGTSYSAGYEKAAYRAFANIYADDAHIGLIVNDNEFKCSNENHCGKQYGPATEISNTKVRVGSIWVNGIEGKEGEVLRYYPLYCSATQKPDCEFKKTLKIMGEVWTISYIGIEADQNIPDSGSPEYYFKTLVFRKN
ncbi:MAG: hypothetical protein QW153_02745 [Candidatus Bilamarchaeaceae archaeon]